jgi:hypothetical protein
MTASTTTIGYTNRNDQTVIRKTEARGNDHNQFIYVLKCRCCAEGAGGGVGTGVKGGSDQNIPLSISILGRDLFSNAYLPQSLRPLSWCETRTSCAPCDQ